MRYVIILFALFALSACSSSSNKEPLTPEQVVAAFEDEKLQLQAADANSVNIVQQGINGVQPSFYTVGNDDIVYLFIFDSVEDRQQGREDFYNRPVDFALHSEYEVNNVLVLLFHGEGHVNDTEAHVRAAITQLGVLE